MVRVAGAAVCAVVVWSGVAASEPAMSKADFEHYYQFLAILFHEAPTDLQTACIEQAEVLYQHTKGWRAAQMTDADRASATDGLRTLYAKLREQYVVLEADWSDKVLALAPHEPITVAEGVPRHAILEVTNRTESSLDLTAVVRSAAPYASPAFTVPPGAMRPVAVPLSAAEGLLLELAPAEAPEEGRQTPVPVKPVKPATIRGTILEGATKAPFPGRVYVTCSDGVLRHGKAFAHNTTLSEKPVVFRPATWRFPFFYSDGHFEILVPPGETTVRLERGFEHPIVETTLTAGAGETHEVTLSSERFLDMKAQGWVSGDTHIHWAKNWWSENEDIALLALVQRAEDLRVANNLLLYQWRPAPPGPFIKPDQFPMGPVPGYCDDNYHIQMAEEYRNDRFYGHINLLNIREVIQPIATGPGSGGDNDALDFPTNKPIIEAAHAQGGICCEAHGMGPFENSDVPANAVTGLSDVLDQMDTEYYYRLLNCGVRLPLGNGSDHPARIAGCARVYVKVDGYFTYQGWIDGLKRGQSFVTSGPLLFLQVNGQDIGSVIDVKPGTPIKVSARAVSRRPIGNLQIVSNGEVMATTYTDTAEATLEFKTIADRPRWFAARCAPGDEYTAIKTAEEYHTARPGIAHTSGIYLHVDGKPVRIADDLQMTIARLREHAADIAKRANFANDDQRGEAIGHIEEAIQAYEARLAQAGE